MNKNKGFIGLGLIIAIVLGVAVVGGGAYYLGKNSPKQDVNNPIVNQKQEAPIVDNNQQNSSSSIKILYPNGGENLISGKTYEIVWKSEISSDVSIWLSKKGASDVADLITGSSLVPASTGKYSWTIPKDNNDIKNGGQFKIVISSKDSSVSDSSDNYFTINSTVNTEESSTESFNHQPGEIKVIKDIGRGQYEITVDLLTPNPKWIPGGSEKFFSNQSLKIRSLYMDLSTKTYNCGEGTDGNLTTADVPENNSIFINKINNSNYKNRYFDISGTKIVAIYEQCLP